MIWHLVNPLMLFGLVRVVRDCFSLWKRRVHTLETYVLIQLFAALVAEISSNPGGTTAAAAAACAGRHPISPAMASTIRASMAAERVMSRLPTRRPRH